MAHCDPFRDQLLDSLYGLLEEREQEELSAHLALCADCRDALVAAQAQQGLLARAARAVECVPEFATPAEDNHAPAPQPVLTSAAPAPVAPQPRLRFRPRTSWLAWSAAAAALLIAVGGTALFQRGRTTRLAHLTTQRQELEQIETRQAKVTADAEARRAHLIKEARSGTLQLHVMGSPRLHAAAPSLLLISTRDADGVPAPTTVSVALLRPADGTALFRTDVRSAGQTRVELPALPRAKAESAQLVVEARTSAASARVEQRLLVAAPDHVTQLLTDRTAYRPGDALYFRAVALDRAGLTPPAQPLTLRAELVDADGKAIAHADGTTEAGGVFAGKLALASRLASGNYTLRLRGAAGAHIIESTQRLEIFRDDQPELALQKQRYRQGETVNLNVYGAQANNQNLRAEVRVNGQRVKSTFATPTQTGQAGGLQNGFQGGFGGRGGRGFQGGFGGGAAPGGALPGAGVFPGGGFGGTLGGGYFPDAAPANRGGSHAPTAQLQFPLPKSLPGNQAVAEILLQDGKRRELVRQPIPLEPRQFAIDFFPEGGELIAGVPNRVYYRVRAEDGELAEPEGHVIVLSRTGVLFDSERQQGVGSFVFTPDPDNRYSVRLTSAAGTREIAEPFAKLGIRTEGLALHVPQPVAAEGEPVEAVLRLRGPARRVLLLAECRGRLVDEQWVEVKSAETKIVLQPLTGTRGIVRLTAYETAAEGLRPLAERLIYRAPTESLKLTADGPTPRAGQSVTWTVRARDTKGAAARAHVLAAVVDERYRPAQERPLAEHFFLATEIRGGADLDGAHLLLSDSPEARRALDLFLGTHGWRRFRHAAKDVVLARRAGVLTGDEAAGTAAVPTFFSRENASLDALRHKSISRYEAALDPVKRDATHELRDLSERHTTLLATARQARAELEAYETLPARLAPIVLLVVLLALVVAGLGLLGAGTFRVLRGRAATGPFAGAFACLLVCVGLAALFLRLAPPAEQAPVAKMHQGEKQQEQLARQFDRPLPFRQDNGPLPPAGAFGSEPLHDATTTPKGSTGSKEEIASGKAGKNDPQQTRETRDSMKDLARFTDRSQQLLREQIATRAYFGRTMQRDRAGGTGHPAPPGGAPNSPPFVAPPGPMIGGPASPSPPASQPGVPPSIPSSLPGVPRGGLAKDGEKKVAEKAKTEAEHQQHFQSADRVYAYELVRGMRAETLLWRPQLLVEGVSVPLRLTVPVTFGNYRVLLLGHDDAGRFGFYQGQLEIAPPADGKGRR